jgi:hypothetical protein
MTKQQMIFPLHQWIIDGNYGSTMELRLTACDTVFLAAQFAPFAALTGYDDAVKETRTVKKLDDYERQIVLQDGTKLPMDDILDMEGELFSILG